MLETLKLVFFGAVIGVANVIPGVSGGTIAVIFNIYDRIVECTHRKNLKKDWPFLVKIAVGAAIGILLFSKAVKWLFMMYPTATQLAFFGLVLGSIPLIFRRTGGYIKKNNSNKFLCGAAFVAMVALLVVMTVMGGAFDKTAGAVITEPSMGLAVGMFFSAILAAFAMILPGISGSFIMLVFGLYMTVISAVSGLTDFSSFNVNNILILLPFGLGAAVGLIGGLYLVRVLLEKAPAPTFSAISGLMVGALFAVFPFSTVKFNLELLVGFVVMAGCAVLAYVSARGSKD